MTKPGRRTKPAELARRDGTYRPDRHGEPVVVGERILPGALPACPAYFGEEHAAAWAELLTPAAEYDLLREVDLAACEMMTVELVTYRQADAVITEEGLWLEQVFAVTKDGEPIYKRQPHPMLGVRNKAAAEFRAWAARFGFTPSDRVGLGLGAVKTRSIAHSLEAKIGKSPRAAAT